jgi:O-antigen/teichoic acid export membrane protein
MKKIYSKLENFTNIIPNFTYFAFSNVITYLLSFSFIILFARNYSPLSFGEFTIAQTIFFLLYSISFSNIHFYLNKKLSTNFDQRRKDIGSSFLITFYASVILYILLASVITLLDIRHEFKILILVLNLILLSEPFSIFYSEIFVRGQFKRIFLVRFFQTVIFFIVKLYLLFNEYNYIYIALAYFVENFFFTIMMLYYFKKNGNKFSKLIFLKEHSINLLKKVILFPIMAFAVIISMRVDIIMISKIIGPEDAGYYSAASRIIIIVLLFGTQLFYFMYPYFSRAIKYDLKFLTIYQNLILISCFIGISCFVASILFGELYLGFFSENFTRVLVSLKILSLNVSFALMINLWIHKQYIATKYNVIFIYQIISIFLNVLLNYYLIKSMGVNGASLATVLSTFISFLIINVTQPKEIYIIFNSFSLENISEIVKTIKIKVFEKKNPDRLANKKD